jgi:hypothetical protein
MRRKRERIVIGRINEDLLKKKQKQKGKKRRKTLNKKTHHSYNIRPLSHPGCVLYCFVIHKN